MDTKQKSHVKVIAVDGPAGSGKSSICQEIGHRLGWPYVNTGLFYRALALIATEQNVDLDNEKDLQSFSTDFISGLCWELKSGRLLWNHRDITDDLRSTKVGKQASRTGQSPVVRHTLLPFQRDLAAKASADGILFDGRDIGTVVFPNADLKIFLIASIEQRAQRRLQQLQKLCPSGPHPTLEEIIATVKQRDQRDQDRPIAPLAKASDAYELDTTTLDFNQTVSKMLELIQNLKD